MRHHLPPAALCKETVERLNGVWDQPSLARLKEAIRPFLAWYDLKVSKVEWLGKVRGRDRYMETFENGHVHVMHPRVWERQPKTYKGRRVMRDEDGWVHTILHEMYHKTWWVRDEKKADEYANQILFRASMYR